MVYLLTMYVMDKIDNYDMILVNADQIAINTTDITDISGRVAFLCKCK